MAAISKPAFAAATLLFTFTSAGISAADLTLIPSNSTWSYFDAGTPSVNWAEPSFDDQSWPVGAAKFGYGEGDERTVISRGPNPDAPYASAFFRKWFNVPGELSAFNRLDVGLLRDDGAVVYLNGAELFRSNMPTGEVTAATYAVTNVGGGAERVYYVTNFSPGILLPGTSNLLAVEVHQSSPFSDDLSFNLRLTLTNVAPQLVRGPYLQSGSSTGVIIRWRTSVPADSRVRWGLSTNALSEQVSVPELVTDHAVAIGPLTPDTLYYYGVGNTTGTFETNSSSFYLQTAPTNTRPFRIWAIGDAGTGTAAQVAVRDAYESFASNQPPDLWLMLGDNAYPTGTDAQYERAVFRMYTNQLPTTLLYPAIGNHETYHNPNNPQDVDYLRIFSLPTDASAGGIASGTELYYSFDYANAHFICLDSMTSDRSMNGAMYAWLEQDLTATTSEWLIAFWHHPPYTKGSHDSDYEIELIEMRENILPLLEAYGVDLVLCGHSHSYERSYLLHGHYGQADTLAPQMVVNGHSGRESEHGPYRKRAQQGTVYVVAGSSGQTSGGALNHPVMFTSLNELGSLIIDVDDKRLDVKFLREDGSFEDYFTLSKHELLEIVSVTVTNAGLNEVTVTWSSAPGQDYQVWRADDLDATPVNWMAVAMVTATQPFTSWSEPLLPNRSTAFYRISKGQ